jgi:hypothetical protein
MLLEQARNNIRKRVGAVVMNAHVDAQSCRAQAGAQVRGEVRVIQVEVAVRRDDADEVAVVSSGSPFYNECPCPAPTSACPPRSGS